MALSALTKKQEKRLRQLQLEYNRRQSLMVQIVHAQMLCEQVSKNIEIYKKESEDK